MLRRMLLCGLAAGALGLPSVASATRMNVNPDAHPPTSNARPINPQQLGVGDNTTHGGGIFGGAEPGHVVGPGQTPIDTESRGPINDVVPGSGTNDTLQSKNPKPVR